MKLAVHGLGYVGLTAAVHFARAGTDVIGYDSELSVVEALNRGQPKAGEFLSYLGDSWPQEALRAVSSFEQTLEADAHLIAVPTERNGRPYERIVRSVLDRLWTSTPAGTLVVIESTLPLGTVDRWMRARASAPDLELGRNWFVAVCPRRDWFADESKNLATLPRVVGGVTEACTERACEVLSPVSGEFLRTDYRTAELTKSLENALLHVPVMLCHQLAVELPHRNVARAVELAGTHWRLPQLYLNIGTGGRCVPLGTRYLREGAGPGLSIAAEADQYENSIRFRVARAVAARIQFDRPADDPASAVVLGMAYRPEFRDMGLSPGRAVAERLEDCGVFTFVHDPMWEPAELARLTHLNTVTEQGLNETIESADAVVLATPHAAYAGLPERVAWQRGQLVLDAQGAWQAHRRELEVAGAKYVRVGEPGWLPSGAEAACERDDGGLRELGDVSVLQPGEVLLRGESLQMARACAERAGQSIEDWLKDKLKEQAT